MSLPRAFWDVPLAHRALHDINAGRPENSLAAVRAAMAKGYGIEIDVQLSGDGAAMVFHDYTLDRVTAETGDVRSHSASHLAGIALHGTDEGIPRLEDVLRAVDGRVPLVVELKDQDGRMGTAIGPLEHAVADALQGYAGPIAVMSFNPNAVALMADLAPDLPRGIVTSAYDPSVWHLPEEICDRLRAIPDFERTRASFISHEASDLHSPRVAQIKARGALICCWTVRSQAEEVAARKIADNITFEGYLAAHAS
ncbi:MAG: glycerophosphodiester phosphodiesterase family protein [Pseudomonadota bacterium]